jgi:hypothetical protein
MPRSTSISLTDWVIDNGISGNTNTTATGSNITGHTNTGVSNAEGDELPDQDVELNDEQLSERFGLYGSFSARQIRSYSDNVLNYCTGFKKVEREPDTPLHFGVELEICVLNRPDVNHEVVDDVLIALNGDAIVCYDGSVSNGFEIVTIPATMAYHKEKLWTNFFGGDLTTRLVGMPYCGNHIHVSKAAWTPLSVGKMMSFIHNPCNWDFLDYIANRGQGSYCTRNEELATPSSIFRDDHYRSSAVNILPSATIEFRLFQSSIRPANLFKNLEFIDALRMFTFHHKISDMSHLKYVEFVQSQGYLWPYLNSYVSAMYPNPDLATAELERSAA